MNGVRAVHGATVCVVASDRALDRASDRERVAKALALADLVLSPGSGLSAVTTRAAVAELAQLVRELTDDQADQAGDPDTGARRP